MSDYKFSTAHRLIHWALAFSVLFLFLTILLRMGWMNKNHMAEIIQTQLTEMNITITPEQAVTVAKSIRNHMWQWHIYAGYAIIVIYILRGVLAVKQGWLFYNPLSKETPKNERFKSWVYLIFYLLLSFSLVTGLLIEFGPASIKHEIEELHEKSLIYLIAFIVLHLFGLIIAELGKEKGIISKMISGK